jgi:hypothetical protein
MKFTSIATVVFTAVAAVAATPYRETNAERFARGMPPLPPQKRSTPAFAAKRTGPSGTPSQCTTGPVQCCQTVGNSSNSAIATILALLGLEVAADVLLGLGCSPISVIGVGAGSCSAQTVCCEDNSSSLISIGCLPITL